MDNTQNRNENSSADLSVDPTATAPTYGMAADRPTTGETFPPGTILAHRYRIEELLGRGGMGTVYRAFDLKLEHVVAVKVLHETGGSTRRRSRLRSEVRLAQQVSHPNVCRVHDISEGDGVVLLSMEFVEGKDLSTLLDRGRLAPDAALSIIRQICAGVAAAHEKGVLHRDLKPANVMVSNQGIALITDFGLAHSMRDETQPGAYEGTPQYMSPEQLTGGEITAESDVYALGLVMYELITGHRVFEGRSLEDLLQEHQDIPDRPSTLAPEIDSGLERLILSCLADEPSNRPPSALVVAEALPGADTYAEAVEAAQMRADQIAAFRSELDDLRQSGVLELDEEQSSAVEHYHRGVLREFADHFDIDLTERGKRLSSGMRTVSLLGALAFSASVFYFFYRFWGMFPTSVQVTVLVAAPLIALVGTEYTSRRDRSGYYSLLTALVALSCIVLNTTAVRSIFNMASSEYDLLLWGLFGLTLAYGYGHRLLLGFALLSLASFVNAWVVGWTGAYWAYCLLRPENFLPAGLLLFALPMIVPHREHPQFPKVYRLVGLLLVLIPVFVLANWGMPSYLPFNPETLKIGYFLLGLGASASAIWIGIAFRWKETANLGSTFFVILLYSRLVDWLWDWMPRYLFFFVVGLTALAILMLLGRTRAATMARFEEAKS